MSDQTPSDPTLARKKQVPAVTGWFYMDPDCPRLFGRRCKSCNTYSFPRELVTCKNPGCGGTDFANVTLGPRGKLWSFTDNRYKPPAPYVSPDPFVPYAIAAVELPAEKIVVLGQVVAGVDTSRLRIGMEMELVIDTLYADEKNEYVIWKWKPTDRGETGEP